LIPLGKPDQALADEIISTLWDALEPILLREGAKPTPEPPGDPDMAVTLGLVFLIADWIATSDDNDWRDEAIALVTGSEPQLRAYIAYCDSRRAKPN